MNDTLESVRKIAIVGLLFFLFAVTFAATGECRPITLSARDGYQISGNIDIPGAWKKGESKIGVVFLHMYGSSKESWDPLVKLLDKENIVSLAIDMRGHGASRFGPDGSDGRKQVLAKNTEIFNHMYLDALAAILYLHKELGLEFSQIGIVGASVGCSVAIHATVSLKTPIGAVVLLTPGKNYLGVNTMGHIKKWLSQPLLILSSEEEQMRGAKQIYTVLAKKGAELVIFEEEDIHGTNMFGEVEGVEERIGHWLQLKLAKDQ